MGLFSNSGSSDDLEIRVARLEAQVAALMPLLDIDQTPTTWQQQAAPAPAGWPALPVVDADVALRVVTLEQLPGRLDQFVFGMLAAYAYGRAAIAQRLPRPRTNDALFVLGGAGVATMAWLIHRGIGTYWEGSALLFVWHGAAGAAVALMLFACAAGSRVADALFGNRILHYVGVISFGLYLWHFPVLRWFDAAGVFDHVKGYRLPWILPPLLISACLLADLSYRLIERPLLRLGRRGSRHPGVTSDLVPMPGKNILPAQAR